MFWTKEKLHQRVKQLSEYRYREAIMLEQFQFVEEPSMAHSSQPMKAPTPHSMEGAGVISLGDHWEGSDLYAWLRTDIRFPEAWAGKKLVGRFDFGRSSGGCTSGFESLLYYNGKPYQGVDGNHKEVFFPVEDAGRAATLHFRLWSGLSGGGKPKKLTHRLQRAEIAWLDEVTDDLYYSAKAVIDTIKVTDENLPVHHGLLSALNRAFLLIDWSDPGSDEFYGSLAQASEKLQSELSVLPKSDDVKITCVGHTHIDVAWLWRLKHTREKCARSFSTVLRLMELFPDYIFLQTQPQLYEYIKEDYPEIYEHIKRRVKEGRWEAGGSMWVEADCNLISGESLVRQILYGKRFFKKEFDADCEHLWLPDVFGYSWALPQVLQKSGIRTFMTTKISWNQYNRMPHDTFMWRGIDGTEILTHFITTPDMEGSVYYTYNGEVRPTEIKGVWDNYRDKQLNQNLLICYGFGDGGGGVNRDMLEMRRRMENMPGLPKVETGRADTFFEQLHETVEQSDAYIHKWDGELYLEYHRGTYTSQAYNKRMNRKLELLLRQAEWIGMVNGVLNGDMARYNGKSLYDAWRVMLTNQFHDIIPGSSIHEVYVDSREHYGQAQLWVHSAMEESIQDLMTVAAHPARRAFTVFNDSAWSRSELVCVAVEEGMENGIWKDASHNELAAERVDDQWLVRVRDIPSLGFASIYFESRGASAALHGGAFTQRDMGLDTPFYRIEWNGKGQLTRIFDKHAGREVLQAGEAANVLQVFEDKPLNFDAWDIDLFYQEKMKEVTELCCEPLVQIGELRSTVTLKWKYRNSLIEQNIIFYADDRRIDFVTKADWHEAQQLLKVAFPVAVRSTEATYDIQFGNVKRPTHWNTSWDQARFESVGHQWVDLSERGYGVSLLNDCKYGHDIKDHVLRLSLIKSAVDPDYAQDQGEHQFTYALLPHQGDWYAGGTVQAAWNLNSPLTVAAGEPIRSAFSLLHTSSDNIMVDAVKKAEDSDRMIVRVHEFAGARGKVELYSDLEFGSWQECDLMEQPIGGEQQGPIRVDMKPYEIKTFIITF